MNITASRNPAYIFAGSDKIMCEVQIDGNQTWKQFLATADDAEPHGAALHAQLILGSVTPFVGPTLAQLQAAQIALVSSACQTAITAGVASSALGAAYTYPTKSTDQMNLTASVAASMIPGNPSNWSTLLWCQSSASIWAFTPHNAVQTQKAGQDVMAGILVMMAKNANLGVQIVAATSVPAVQAIVWS